MNRSYRFLLLSCVLTALVPQVLSVQNDSPEQQGRPREIRSKDFTQNRPAPPPQGGSPGSQAPATGTGGTRPSQKPARPLGGAGQDKGYKLVKSWPRRRLQRNVRPPAVKQPDMEPESVASGPVMIEQVGVTLWRLRPAAPGERGPHISVKGASGIPTASIPVRVSADHFFSLGDSVRLTVESPQSGYLYVFDRERYEDGSLGEAMMIFPTSRTRGGDNRMSAGYLIDIPAWTDSVPYFLLKSGRADYAGELLTFLISPRPLQDLPIGDTPLAVPRGILSSLEEKWEVVADLYEMDSGVGEVPSQAEIQAAQNRTRQLVQTEAIPQTIYRMRVRRDSPFLLSIPLRARAR